MPGDLIGERDQVLSDDPATVRVLLGGVSPGVVVGHVGTDLRRLIPRQSGTLTQFRNRFLVRVVGGAPGRRRV